MLERLDLAIYDSLDVRFGRDFRREGSAFGTEKVPNMALDDCRWQIE